MDVAGSDAQRGPWGLQQDEIYFEGQAGIRELQVSHPADDCVPHIVSIPLLPSANRLDRQANSHKRRQMDGLAAGPAIAESNSRRVPRRRLCAERGAGFLADLRESHRSVE